MRKTRKALSLFLALVLSLSLAVPAMAADIGKLTLNGRTNTGKELSLLTVGAEDISSVTVESGSESKSYDADDCKAGVSNVTLSNGIVYRIYNTTDANGYRTVRFQVTSDLLADVDVTVEKEAAQHKIFANSGFYGQNNNMGGTGTCTMDKAEMTVASGDATYSVTFTPDPGQEITKLNLRVDAENATPTIVDVNSTSATIKGQTFSISKIGEKVKVSCKPMREIYITALTGNETAKHTLTVNTDSFCSSNVTTATLSQGTSKDVTLTPSTGYRIGSVQITTGSGATGTIAANASSVTVSGKQYTLNRKLDGSAVLTVPSIAENITVQANSKDGNTYVEVVTDRYTTCTKEGVNYVTPGDPFSVTFNPRYDDNSLVAIKVTTASGTYRADADDSYVVVGGTYYPIYHGWNGEITINFTSVNTSMKVEVTARDTIHDVDVSTSSYIDADVDYDYIRDGEEMDVTFTPDSGKEVRQIRVTYDGSTYKVNPQEKTYITVDGTRWPISVDYYGVVTLTMKNVQADVSIYASTSATSSTNGSYRITKSEDTHSNISYTGSNPFDDDESTTIRVWTDDNYIVDNVKFTMNGKSKTIEPFETSFVLDGETYNVDWTTNADFEVYFHTVTGNLTVTAKSERGTEKSYNGTPIYNGTYRITQTSDSHSSVTYTGTNPFYYGEASVVSVSTDKNYIISNIRLTMNGRTANIDPFDTSFVLDGRTYYVNWTTNRDCRIYFDTLTANLSVNATSKYGKEVVFNGTNPSFPVYPNNPGYPVNPGYPDGNTGTMPTTTYHPAYMQGYGNGCFGPSNNMTRAQAIAILSRLYVNLSEAGFKTYAYYPSYSDAPANQWYSGYVGYAKQAGLLNVLTGGGSYLKPNAPITRAEFLALLCNFSGQVVTGTVASTRYSDVPANYWYAPYINYCTNMGWVNGYSNGLFQPNTYVTRAEVCVMVNRINGRYPIASNTAYGTYFYDVPASYWAYADIMEATTSHYVSNVSGGVEIWSR